MIVSGLVAVLALMVATVVVAGMGSLHDRPSRAAAKEVTTVILRKDPPRPAPPPKIVTVFQNIPAPHRAPAQGASTTRPTAPTIQDEQPSAPTPSPTVRESEMPCPGYPQFTAEPADGCPSPPGGDD